MPNVHHVRRAAKSVPELGIVRGQEYWFIFLPKPRGQRGVRGARRVFLRRPRPSQVTSNPFLRQVYAVQERLEDAARSVDCPDAARSLRDDLLLAQEEIGDLGREQAAKLAAMPRGLARAAETIIERGLACGRIAGDLGRAADRVQRLIDQEGETQGVWYEVLDAVDWDVS